MITKFTLRKLRRLLILIIGWWILTLSPTIANTDKLPLTETLLQERINHPVLSQGNLTIDLSSLQIDLSDSNADFRILFYQQLQNKINRSTQPIGLDFSNSLIRGNFNIQSLGLSTPLSEAALPQTLSPAEKEQLRQDKHFVADSKTAIPSITIFRGILNLNTTLITNELDFSNTFFLQRVEMTESKILQTANFNETRFGKKSIFSKVKFSQDVNFSYSTFWDNTEFNQSQFSTHARFNSATFQKNANFREAEFKKLVDLSRSQWLDTADFSQVYWYDRVLFTKSRFFSTVSFSNTTFEKGGSFRSCRFKQGVNFQDIKLLDKIDFGNATFEQDSSLNVAGLAFDSDSAELSGDTGILGRAIYLTKLKGNEAVIRNLVRNFRYSEQIADANLVEYKAKQLKLKELTDQVWQVPFKQLFSFRWIETFWSWILLSLLLFSSNYGTSFGLVLGNGVIIIAFFGCIFWFIDRWRKWIPYPILPNRYDIICMTSSVSFLIILGIFNVFRCSQRPWATLSLLAVLLLPISIMGLSILYIRGRYHNLLKTSYLLMDGSLRELRLLIVRLPILPEFAFFRDRYSPLLWEKHWNWLNYYDFSCNNFLKIGFNDIRLRDQFLPNVVSLFAWYQWSLGLLYIALLFWTLSRTIPGLNLLIYLK